jgi:DNA-binding response OmpR family regulator
MGDMEDALKVGADGYFTKPFDRAIVEKIKHRLTKLSKKKSKGI